MNRKGFTLVELLSVLVILGLIVGITIPTVISVMNHSKDKSEEAFVGTIKDAMNVYLSGNEKNKLDVDDDHDNDWGYCNASYDVATISFRDVIDSTYAPINTASLVNPKNDKNCGDGVDALGIKIYRHNANYVYYYAINSSYFVYEEDGNFYECLTLEDVDVITNFKDADEIPC